MKAGDLFVITSGDYSDYGMHGHFKALQDFSMKEQQEIYINSLPMVPVMKYGEWLDGPRRWVKYDTPIDTGQLRKEFSSTDGFQAYLIRQGLVEEMDVTEVHYDDIHRRED